MGLQKDSKPPAAGSNSAASQNSDAGHKRVDELNDSRGLGEWQSRFGYRAWTQIVIELIYLVVLLGAGSLSLLDAALAQHVPELKDNPFISSFLGLRINPEMLKWIALWIAGLLGGAVFALKWLYHSVAKAVWNCDRVLWRLIVPFNSATVSLFTGFLFSSGAVPFLKNEAFDKPLTTLAFGFIFGYFSDNILAALQNFAQKLFGTLGQSE